MSEKRKIGIDIDGVVVEFVKGYLQLFEKRYNKRVGFENISSYNLWENLGISRQEGVGLVYELYDSDELNKLGFVEGAKKSLEKLAGENSIYFITSRDIKVKEKTKEFFYSHFPKNSYEFIFSGDFFGGEKTKQEILNELKISLMIEDNPHYALDCAEKGIKVFLLNKPWNKNYQEHENIIKVKNWEEIMEKLEGGE